MHVVGTVRASTGDLLRVGGTFIPAPVVCVEKGVYGARNRRTSLVALQIDSSDGLATSTREILNTILASPVSVPLSVFSPDRATCAGTCTVIAPASWWRLSPH